MATDPGQGFDAGSIPVGTDRRILPVGVNPDEVTAVQAYDPTSGGNIDSAPMGFGRALLDMASNLPTFGGTLDTTSNFSGSDARFRPDGEWTGNQQNWTWSKNEKKSSDPESFYISQASTTLTQFMYVLLKGRGDKGGDALYSFLINPKSLTVDRQTVDVQAQSRSGWQLGIWGDDVINISMSGQTAGQYFSAGLSSKFQEFTASYRNFLELSLIHI